MHLRGQQITELCKFIRSHPESVYMGERVLDEIQNLRADYEQNTASERSIIWSALLNTMINDDAAGMFLLLVGKDFEDVLRDCSIIPSDTNKEAYIPIMPWELTEEQQKKPFDIMNALRFAEAARSAAQNGDGDFECPLCGGDAKGVIADNGHLHAHCSGCGLRVAE